MKLRYIQYKILTSYVTENTMCLQFKTDQRCEILRKLWSLFKEAQVT